jgi:hypothetical protein
MKMTVADMIAVLIAASTSVAIAQTNSYRPTKAATHQPHRLANFLGHTSHLGQISRPNRASRAAAQRSAPGLAGGRGTTTVANLSENNEMSGVRAAGAEASAESLHTAIR